MRFCVVSFLPRPVPEHIDIKIRKLTLWANILCRHHIALNKEFLHKTQQLLVPLHMVDGLYSILNSCPRLITREGIISFNEASECRRRGKREKEDIGCCEYQKRSS